MSCIMDFACMSCHGAIAASVEPIVQDGEIIGSAYICAHCGRRQTHMDPEVIARLEALDEADRRREMGGLWSEADKSRWQRVR